jgi:hypothetical protein
MNFGIVNNRRALSRQGEDIGYGPPPNTALQHLPPNNPQALIPFLSDRTRFIGPHSMKVRKSSASLSIYL